MSILQNEHEMNKEETTEYWGVSSSIDLYDCDLALMQNADAIREFVKALCDRIKMRRYGETQIVFFGDEPRVQGFSMTQLIETSLISPTLQMPAAPFIWMCLAALLTTPKTPHSLPQIISDLPVIRSV